MSAPNLLRNALAACLCLSSALLGSAALAGETAPSSPTLFKALGQLGQRCLRIDIPGFPCPGVGSSWPRPVPRPHPSGSDLGKFASLLISGSLDRLLPLETGAQRFLIDPRWDQGKKVALGSIEVRVGQTLLSDCNGLAFAGAFKPVSSVRSERYQFWSFQSGGLISTLRACPDATRYERLVWMSGKPAQIPWSGRATVIDLPEGWTLQWRRQGGSSPGPWINIRSLQTRLSSSGAASP
ncbi:ecotin family protein [Synechococcus sp. A10-1-5-1]|uniref:ecotin family protein n=1 Tax=Synechococcus sp. A10-1-5-1 TaxID=2936507 RepID=UPI00200168B2|nr:ecotin family protein [Synechococcus sp. A10-1-5-1]UPM50335.1 ecotin family protein [Synechococcus sp. A10-1-5-1]